MLMCCRAKLGERCSFMSIYSHSLIYLIPMFSYINNSYFVLAYLLPCISFGTLHRVLIEQVMEVLQKKHPMGIGDTTTTTTTTRRGELYR
uniref:Uncharacterized protein n=1 Tax=Arundo donax TaxID=35708 RepID=A0A0A9HJJ3_ARUDO